MANDFGLGVNPSDFGMLANQYNVAELDPQVQNEIQKMLISFEQQKKLGELGVNLSVQNQAAAAPPIPTSTTFKTGPDGQRTVTTTMPEDDAIAYQRAMQFQKQALGGFAQQSDQLRMELERAQAQPWQQLGTALAANMANQPGMPGWARGLGQTAAQMNPTVDQLRAQYLGVMGKGADIAQKGIGLEIAQQRTLEDAAARKAGLLAGVEKQRLTDVERVVDNAATAIKAGTGNVDTKAIMDDLVNAGATKPELNAKMSQLESLAKNVGTKWAAERNDRLDAEKRAEANATRSDKYLALAVSAAGQKTAEKSEEQKDLEALAQSLAAGELTGLSTVASMRGGRRERVFRLAREINPSFNTAEINRKIKMVDLYTTGKQGEALQFYGTFLEHAGEATETIKGINLTSSALANKTWNWWRKNMTDSPEFARLKTSLEPVGIEFERFLIGTNYALQKQDRERMAALVSGDLPLNMVAATLNQMGKTADDRFNELNFRYKKTVGEDIPLPFSPQATAGGAKIGLHPGTSSGSQPKGGGKYPWER